MRISSTYILGLATVLLLALSCTKDRPAGDGLSDIIVSPEITQTKSMLAGNDLNTNGTQIKVFDYISNGIYIDDVISPKYENGLYTGTWSWGAGPYPWTSDTHEFFGWLLKDGNMPHGSDHYDPETFFEDNELEGEEFHYDSESRFLTIGPKTMNWDTDQFDFMFSNVLRRDNTPNSNRLDFSAVDLSFNHLFTAVAFGVKNQTDEDIFINEFRVQKIPNRRYASIDFAGNADVTYYDVEPAAYFSRSATDINLPKDDGSNEVVDVFNTTATQPGYMMMWPLDASYLHSDEVVAEGNIPENYKIYIDYTSAGHNYVKWINFADNVSWEAGQRYHYKLTFADKIVELKAHVSPWTHEPQNIDYTNSVTIDRVNMLTWNEEVSAVDHTKKTVTLKDAQPAKAMFTLQAPQGGTWFVSLTGDVYAFEVSPSSGAIDGATSNILVKPLVKDPMREYKAKLKFAVRRADGRVITADREIQGDDNIYTIVLPANQ